MALTETTLAAACAATDSSIVLTSAGTIAVGYSVLVDQEVMTVTKAYVAGSVTVPVLRGQGGGVPIAHPITAAVEYGSPSDSEWGATAAQTPAQFLIAGRADRQVRSYSASGAITLPDPGASAFAILNAVSTTILAMTVALPSKAHDGCEITIASRNGTGAHTITVAGRLNGAPSGNYTVFTAPASPFMIRLVALDSFWYVISGPAWTGTVTLITGGIA